ncbi:MAG: Ig-like domain-containing protein [Bacteroidota bacterium]
MKARTLLFLLLALFLFSCKETIVENQVPKEFTNDLLHGDILGKVIQKGSKAKVYVSQVNVIDSTMVSESDGSFLFRELRAGNYDLTVRADNYRIYSRTNLEVPGGAVVYTGDIDLSTVPDLVSQVYPEDNSEIVYNWQYGRIAISVMFTHPMDRASVEQAFSTNPPSDGIFVWGNYTSAPLNTMYSRSPWGDFQSGATITTFSKVTSFTFSMAQKDSYPDTLYTVTLATTAHDTMGNPLRFPLQFSFRTVQSNITIDGIQTIPAYGDMNVNPLNNRGIDITFPRRMDPASTEGATSIQPPLNKTFLWPAGNIMRIYTGGPFMSDTTISVTIAGTAKDKDGNPLGQPFSFWFRVAPFSVTSTSPANADLFVSRSQQISVNFNNYVPLQPAQAAFAIDPPAAGSIAYAGYAPYEDPSAIVFTPSGLLQANTKYTVTISSAVTDMYGIHMRSPYSFSFVTRPN